MTRPHDISQASIAAGELRNKLHDIAPISAHLWGTSGVIEVMNAEIARALSDAYARGLEDAARAVENAALWVDLTDDEIEQTGRLSRPAVKADYAATIRALGSN